MRGFFNGSIARLIGGAIVLSAVSTPAMAVTRIQIAQAMPGPDGEDVGETRIVVDGKQNGPYDEVVTEQVEVWVRSTIPKLPGERRTTAMRIEIEGEVFERDNWRGGQDVSNATERLRFAFPYVDPLPGSNPGAIANLRRSPVDYCNRRLAELSGKARQDFLSRGDESRIQNAYIIEAWAKAEWVTEEGRIFKEFKWHTDTYSVDVPAGATIECKALNRPRPRTETRTQGANSGQTGKRLEPTVRLATLRVEPAAKEVFGSQLCPTQLRLYGRVQTIRAFEGKAVIFGTAYFSPVTQLNFTHGGNRNLVATYPLKWNRPGGLAAAGAQAPTSQSVSLTMNVTTTDNKVLKQARETVTVSCRPVTQLALIPNLADPPQPPPPGPRLTAPTAPPVVTPPVAGAGFSWNRPVAPPPAAASLLGKATTSTSGARLVPGIDLAIRRVDRNGPSGATRLFLRNGGDAVANGCRVLARKGGKGGWIEIQGWDVAVQPGATVELAAGLPNDAGVDFAVDCPGESAERLANNLALLP